MTRSERDPDRARAELYEIMRADLPFEQKVDRALELGEVYLDVQNAHLTRIDASIDFWKAIASTDPPEGAFPAGQVLDLRTTYCRRVGQEGSTIALTDAPEQGWEDDPAFEEHGLHCYHGTPLTLDDEVWGTLCFVSETPREEPFSEGETLFAELIARLLEHELRAGRQRSEIGLQANLIGVLSRVLRHNLRNDLNVIRGQLKILADREPDRPLENGIVLSKIDTLVDLANTARKIESIASSDLDRQPVELCSLLENVINRVERNFPSASFTLDASGDVYIQAIPSLRTSLEELVENAAKHSGEAPEVTVSIDSSENEVQIVVRDNGPGLPADERDVLRRGAESPLIHGSGLGLWLSYWIIANHDGSVGAQVTDAGTKITVSLPRTSSLSEFAESESLLGRFHREQEKFEAVFEESFDAIVIIDDDGRYTDVNESAAQLFGLPRGELQGRSITEFAPDDLDVEATWEALMQSDGERSTFTLVRADGSERVVEYTAVPDIVPGQHLAILRDASERIERERELLSTKDRLEAVIEASPDPILVLDDQGVIERWNEAAEATFGYTPQEAVGAPLRSLGIVPVDDDDTFAERFERAIAGERFDDLVVNRRTKDGDDIHLSLSTAPLYDSSGGVSGLVAVAQDITERLARDRRHEALATGFPDLCFIIDEDWNYREILASPSSEQFLITDADELVGRSVTSALPSEVGLLFGESIDRTIDTGNPQTFHFGLQVPAGPRIFEARTHPLTETVDEKRMVSMVVRDITELPGGDEVATAV